MKTLKIMMVALMMTIVTSASAMTYTQAKQQALFLADKMAYELNLTDEQYEAAYEINLDYLMAVNDYNDIYGTYWTYRNMELQSVLTSWQYNQYIAAEYFYRPVYWSNNRWNWRIYSRYAADRYYYDRPTVYVTYRGGNSRNYYTSRSWRQPSKPAQPKTQPVRTVNRNTNQSGNRTFGNLSTSNRTTNINVTNVNVNNNRSANRSFGSSSSNSNRSFGTSSNKSYSPARTATTSNRSFGSTSTRSVSSSNTSSSHSFGGHR